MSHSPALLTGNSKWSPSNLARILRITTTKDGKSFRTPEHRSLICQVTDKNYNNLIVLRGTQSAIKALASAAGATYKASEDTYYIGK